MVVMTADKLLDFKYKAHQRSLPSAPRAAYTQIATSVKYEILKTQHGLMDLSKQVREWVRWPCCFHAVELSEPAQPQNTQLGL